MAWAIPSGGQTSGGKSSGKAWMGVAGFAAAAVFFNLHAFAGGSGLVSTEAPAVTMTFVGECLSAETKARAEMGEAATPEGSADLRKLCEAAFNRGKPTEAMLAIREGRSLVIASSSPAKAGGGF